MQRLPMSAAVLALALVTIALAPSAAAGADAAAATPTVEEGNAAGTAWLAQVDAGRYEESWTESGALFRKAVTKEQWQQALGAARGPLGALKSRRLDTTTEASTLPGAPDGRYLVMQFRSAFADKAEAIETVTTVVESDGKWRVVGYFIR